MGTLLFVFGLLVVVLVTVGWLVLAQHKSPVLPSGNPVASALLLFSKNGVATHQPQIGTIHMQPAKKGDEFEVSLVLKDADGNPTVPDGVPEWTSSDPTAASVTPAADGLTAKVVVLRSNASTTIGAKLDGEQGEGVTVFEASGVIAAAPANVNAVELSFTKLEPAPAPAVDPAPAPEPAPAPTQETSN